MDKKVIWFVFLIVFFSSLVYANSHNGIEDLKKGELLEGVEDLKELKEDGNISSLGEKYKERLLENKLIAAIDKTLRSINFMIFILLGENYNFSFKFIFTFLMWFVFFLGFSWAVINYSTFSEWVGNFVGLIMSIVLGHLQAYNFVYFILSSAILSAKGFLGFFFYVILFGFMIAMIILFVSLRGRAKKMKEKINRAVKIANMQNRQKKLEESQDTILGAIAGDGK